MYNTAAYLLFIFYVMLRLYIMYPIYSTYIYTKSCVTSQNPDTAFIEVMHQ